MGRFGFRAVNKTTGSIQIDDQYWNLAVLAKSSITSNSTPEADTSRYLATITVTSSEPPILGVVCSGYVGLWKVAKSGTSWTFTYFTETASQAMTVFRFGKPADLGPGWGVRIKRGGSIRYDSRHQYARVAGVQSGTGLSAGSASYDSAKTYAIVHSLPAGQWNYTVQAIGSNFTSTESRSLMMATASSGTVAWKNVLFFLQLIPAGVTGPARVYNQIYAKWAWLVLDVTGY